MKTLRNILQGLADGFRIGLNKSDYVLFLLFFIVISPLLMVYGALIVLPRFYHYVSNTVNNKDIKMYKF